MNKIIKGSIAGAAGIALLLGGAGTFALWNDSATVDGQNITSGKLSISSVTGGGWFADNGNTDYTDDAPITIGTYQVIPGKSIYYKGTTTITAEGNGLSATLGFAGGLTGDAGLIAESATLLAVKLGSSAEVTGPATVPVAPTGGPQSATIRIKYTFNDVTTTAGNALAAQGKTVNFSTVKLELKQR
ncbi:alternate-type signal peptide domain-containing protein [Leifsonia sp. YIM 134122]|uniref:Alternate-type signal peptide domain-containing protein n=1 Tax=Leifsonia stereocauli TaxID=3134136 RepID=A0ABU9W8E9_9MICO